MIKLVKYFSLLCGLVGLATILGHGPVQSQSRGHNDKVLQGLDCSACHTTTGWALSNSAGQEGGFDHKKTGFPLTGEHKAVLCNSCHIAKRSVSRDCYTCHKDQHRGRLGLQCESCHNTTKWQQTRAIRRHRLTRLPLTGMHAVIDCNSCHQRRGDRRFQPVPADCFSCHEADYRRDLHPSHQGDPTTGQAPFSRVCSKCHQTSAWTPAFVNPSDPLLTVARQSIQHDRSFLLSRGPHRQARCENCHLNLATPRAVSCGGCHVHNRVSLRRQHRRSVPKAATSCIACHPRGLAR